MRKTSCYSMAKITTPTLITMTTPITTTITSISPIYEASSVTFYEDTKAYTTVDIDKSKTTKLKWCPYNTLGPFTVNIVT